MKQWWNRLLCSIFGHKHGMKFHKGGLFFCWSAGSYDAICKRCDFKWETTPEGIKALAQSRRQDPRTPEGRAWLETIKKK